MSSSSQNRLLISLSSRSPLPMGVKVLLSPLVPSSPLASPFLPLQAFGPGDNGESWHHDRKMFQFSFQQAFTSLLCVFCVRTCVYACVVSPCVCVTCNV